jgi:translation initiation factor IF-2
MQGRQDFTDRSAVKLEEVKSVGKVRVYQVAKEIGLENKTLVTKIQSLGIDIKNHMSSLDLEDVQRVKRALEKERQESLVEERLSATVIRRRSKSTGPGRRSAPAQAASSVRVAEEGASLQAPGSEKVELPEEHHVVPPPISAAALVPDEGAAERVEGASLPQVEFEEPDQEGGRILSAVESIARTDELEPSGTGSPSAQPAITPVEKPKAEEGSPSEAAPPKVAAVAAPPPVVHRYAPGFKPGMQYGPKAREQQRAQQQQQESGEGTLISAADAMKMIAPQPKPKVVITDLDNRRPGQRREMVTHKELFTDRRFKSPGKKKKVVGNKKAKKTEITTPAQHKRVIRMEDAIGVGEVAHQMGIKATEVLKKLWAMGLTNMNINQSIDADTATLLAGEFGFEIEDRSFSEEKVLHEIEDQPEDLQPRPPVVTVMGHVDHGKTSLLDAIRNSAVAEGEAGGITQHIGAYKVSGKYGDLVFIDTPGHEAFTAMRARGATCTDIVILVVAADDGVMPTTIEALDHAKEAEVPIIVAVNKIDKADANPDRVRSELSERGLIPEEWGGETIFVNVSARTKEGLDVLLESLNLQAEILELKANPNKSAKGIILEAKVDRARGVMCTVLVQEGTIRVGDTVVTGEHWGKVRAILDDRGMMLKEAGPCTPVEILGLSGVPESGEILNSVTDEKAARILAEHRRNEHRRKELAGTASKTVEEILGKIKSGEAREVKLLVKADVHGSAEAVREALRKLSTDQVSANVISAAVGGIHETDVNLAKAAGAIIVGFNVRPAGKASQLAEREGVEIRV